MDKVGGFAPSRRLVVRIPKERLESLGNLWIGRPRTIDQRSRSEDARGGMNCEDEAHEGEGCGKITHFKKRLIRTHSVSAPPADLNQEGSRSGRHHLPATTPSRPTAPLIRPRLSHEATPPSPRSPETQQVGQYKDIVFCLHNVGSASDSQHCKQWELGKVFCGVTDAIRAPHYRREEAMEGVAEVESFLHTCEDLAKSNTSNEDHGVFYSFLDSMRDFTERIRVAIGDESRTTPLLTVVEENFYKNMFFGMINHLNSNLTKGNIIVLPFVRHCSCIPQYWYPRRREEPPTATSKPDAAKPTETPPIDVPASTPLKEEAEESEDKEAVRKQIEQVPKKKPKYKEIVCIEIDSDCDSSDEIDVVPPPTEPIKEEPKATSGNQEAIETSSVVETPPKTPEASPSLPTETSVSLSNQTSLPPPSISTTPHLPTSSPCPLSSTPSVLYTMVTTLSTPTPNSFSFPTSPINTPVSLPINTSTSHPIPTPLPLPTHPIQPSTSRHNHETLSLPSPTHSSRSLPSPTHSLGSLPSPTRSVRSLPPLTVSLSNPTPFCNSTSLPNIPQHPSTHKLPSLPSITPYPRPPRNHTSLSLPPRMSYALPNTSFSLPPQTSITPIPSPSHTQRPPHLLPLQPPPQPGNPTLKIPVAIENHGRPRLKMQRKDDSEANLQQAKRPRMEPPRYGYGVANNPLMQANSSNRAEESFRQQFPNTVISRRDADLIANGRVVVLEKGRVEREQGGEMPAQVRPLQLPQQLPPLELRLQMPLLDLPGRPNVPMSQLPPPPPYPISPAEMMNRLSVLSKKDKLDARDYVNEIEGLFKLPPVHSDFKQFYAYVTKVQILRRQYPLSFRLFLELLNQGGLNEYLIKFTEYIAKKKGIPSPLSIVAEAYKTAPLIGTTTRPLLSIAPALQTDPPIDAPAPQKVTPPPQSVEAPPQNVEPPLQPAEIVAPPPNFVAPPPNIVAPPPQSATPPRRILRQSTRLDPRRSVPTKR